MANEEYNKTFLQADSLQDAKDSLEEVYEANPDAVIIVEEEGKECIIEHGKQLNFVPSGGTKGQVLTSDEEGNPEWGATLDTKPFIVVDALPNQPESGNEGKLHLVLNSEGKDDNLYDEYLWVNGKWEKIGTAKIDVDLANYLTSKQAAQKYYPKVDGDNLATQLDTLDFTVETLNHGLGESEQRIDETEERLTEVEQCNVVAEEIIDEDTFEDIGKVTREELKKDLFIDMWNEAWGEFGKYDPENAPDPNHPFYGNELWMTYEEAVIVMQAPPGPFLYNLNSGYAGFRGRTVIPPRGKNDANTFNGFTSYDLNCTFFRCANLEVVRISGEGSFLGIKSINLPFTASPIRKVLGGMDIGALKTKIRDFGEMGFLEEIKLKKCSADIDLNRSSKLNIESFKFLISNAANTSPITVTVHQDIFSALQGNADSYPFNDGTQEEWENLLTDALAKNIQFATA